MLTATAETGAGAGGVAEGDPAASSDSHGSNSTNSRISSTSSNSTSRGDVPTLGGEKHTDRGGAARYSHSKAGARGFSRGNIK